MIPIQGFYTRRQHNSSLHCLCCIWSNPLWRGCYSGSTCMFLFYIWCLSMIFKIFSVYSKLPFLCICRLTNGSSTLHSFFQALNLKLLAHFLIDTWCLEPSWLVMGCQLLTLWCGQISQVISGLIFSCAVYCSLCLTMEVTILFFRNWSTMGKSKEVKEISKPCPLVQQHSCRLCICPG